MTKAQLSAQDIDTLNLVMTVNVPSGKTLSAVKDLYTEEEITAISGSGESISCEIRTLVLCGIFVSILWTDVHGETNWYAM